MARHDWRLVFAAMDKMEKAIQAGIYEVDSTVTLWDYHDGIPSLMRLRNPTVPIRYKVSKAEMDMAFKIVKYRIHNPVKADPPTPSPVSGATSPQTEIKFSHWREGFGVSNTGEPVIFEVPGMSPIDQE
jgi:hypothetical protein